MIIVDTGFWVALANKNDNYHEAAKQTFSQYNEPLITTWCVVTETCYFLQARRGVQASITFINAMSQGLFKVFEIKPDHIARLKDLMTKYRDVPMDLADSSLVLLAEEYKTGRILSLNIKDFSIYQWNNKNYFENLFRS
ncbi:MAG: toxin-antitoxin system COG2402 family toxin component [Phormidium sp. OSCR]|nr:MAG: toxin-antitoxin system COG2402 family toxin component [Phormidium sp. OSCR]